MNDLKIDTWSAILQKIKVKIAESSFVTWFEYTSLEELNNEEILIGVPNKFAKTFIIEKFSEVVSNAAKEILGEEKIIKYKIVHELRNKIENARIKGVNLKDEKSNLDAQDISSGSLDDVNTRRFNSPSVVNDSFYSKPNFRSKNDSFKYAGLPLVQAYKLDNFIIGPNNRVAYSGIMSVLENPGVYNPIFLYGKSGLGKTHILHALCHELLNSRVNTKIVFVSCEEFVNDYINHVRNSKMNDFREKYRKIDTLIIDDIHFLGQGDKKSTQEEFFHTFDALYNASCQIIVSSDAHPKDIASLQEKMQMRFISGLVAAIEPPNLATRIKILQQKCKDKNYDFPKEVIEFIAGNITSNCRELEGALVKIHAQAIFSERPVTLELAQQTLEINKSASFHKQSRVSTNDILQKISEFFDSTTADLKEHKRGKNAVPRQLGMLVMRQVYSFSYQEICEVFNCKSHASVMHGEKTVQKIINKDNNVKMIYNKLLDHLQNKF